jgi:hypothetical protein
MHWNTLHACEFFCVPRMRGPISEAFLVPKVCSPVGSVDASKIRHAIDTHALRPRLQTPLAGVVRTSPTSQIKTQEGAVA